jgi:glycine/D-amino acid oxidase-like deaminating enzyme
VFSGIIATEPLPQSIADRILIDGAALYENGRTTVYYRVDVNRRLLMGGRSPMRDKVTAGRLAWLSRYALRLWPEMRGARWTHAWNGQLALTTDHYPHLHEPHPDALICLGYNGRGIAMATAMGGEIARRLTGTPVSELDMPVTGIREIPFHGLWKQAATARILYGRMRDALGL